VLTPAPCDLVANRSESPIRPPCWVRFLTGRPTSATSYWAACVFKVFCPTPAAPCLFLLFLQPELGRCWSAVNLLVMCVVICQADSGKGLEQAASSSGVQGDAALLCCLPPGVEPGIGSSLQLHCEFHLARSDGPSARPSRFASFACSPMSRPPPLWRWKGQEGAPYLRL